MVVYRHSTIGHFSLVLLASIKSLSGKAWRSQLQVDVSHRLQRDVSKGQIQNALKWLKEKAYIVFTSSPNIGKRGGPVKIYSLTPCGEDILKTVSVQS